MASGKCVIVVGSSPADLRLIGDSLAPGAVQVLAASSVPEALRQQMATEAAVIVYDMDAPEPWRVALEQFQRRRPGSPVVFLSRVADNELWMDLLQTGAYDLLLKPFHIAEIGCVLRRALSGMVGANAGGLA
jgi:DNA-binding NtrC family response regulator